MRKRLLVAVALPVFLLLVIGCSGSGTTQLGTPIPSDAQVTTLGAVLASAGEYNGKEVVISGRVSGQCPSLCEFFLRDGVHTATIFPQGYAFPKLETGRPVTVYAAVTAGSHNVVLSALGVRLEKETP